MRTLHFRLKTYKNGFFNRFVKMKNNNNSLMQIRLIKYTSYPKILLA